MPHATPAAPSSVLAVKNPRLPPRKLAARRARLRPREPSAPRRNMERNSLLSTPAFIPLQNRILPRAGKGSLQLCRHRFDRCRLRRFGCEIFPWIDEAVALQLVLLVVQLAVAAVQRQQLGMRAPLDDLSCLEHQNLVCAPNGRQAMGDDERGPSFAQ